MTDKSKSQRKRRLQLNAEEFAPPPNIYDAAEEPRPDDAWVRFYGGESRGGVKRLASLDDDAVAGHVGPGGPEAGQSHLPSLAAGAASAAESDAPPLDHARTLQRIEEKSLNDSASAGGTPAGGATAHVREFPREAPPRPAPAESPAGGRRKAPPVEDPSAGGGRTPLPAAAEAGESFETWLKRWSPWLKRGGSVRVCRAFFDLTHGRGSPDCFTSNSAIMEITGLSRAQCIRNIHYLIEMGFLEELGESNNREAKGTYYRFHLVPRSLVSL